MTKELSNKTLETVTNSALKDNKRQIKFASFKRLSTELRNRLKASFPAIRKSVLLSLTSVATFMPVQQASSGVLSRPTDTTSTNKEIITSKAFNIEQVVQAKTEALQNQIVNNIDSLQQAIRNAKRVGRRNQVVKRIFDGVYTRGGLSGSYNYCVAGAMYARLQCKDDVFNQILPDPEKTARDYKYGGHPNTSCPYMRDFFKKSLNTNHYAERGDRDFKDFLKTLEPGDILTVTSATNTSTGEHCVTCTGTIENGQIPVKSLNGEGTYKVSFSKVVGAAKLMEQYRENLTKKLEQEKTFNRPENMGINPDNLDFNDYVKPQQTLKTLNNDFVLKMMLKRNQNS